MGYKVLMRRNASEEERLISVDLDWHDHSLFWWTEGNFGCDCNRRILWDDDDSDEDNCGDTEFTVIHAVVGEEIILIDTTPKQEDRQ